MSLKKIYSIASLVWLVGLFIISAAQAQNSDTEKFIHLYNHGIKQDFNYNFNDLAGVTHNYQKEGMDYVNIGVGYRITKAKNRFQEFSLVQFNYHKDDDLLLLEEENSNLFEPSSGDFTKEINLRLRWEYGINVPLNNNDKIIPSISVGIDPFWNYYRSVPKTSAGFPITFHQFGWDLRLLLATAFQISPKMQIHIGIPIGFIRNQWNRTQIENPILTENQRNQSSFDADFGVVDWQLRVGVGFGI